MNMYEFLHRFVFGLKIISTWKYTCFNTQTKFVVYDILYSVIIDYLIDTKLEWPCIKVYKDTWREELCTYYYKVYEEIWQLARLLKI